MAGESEEIISVSFELEGQLPLSDRLLRELPAADEGPEQAWELAQQVIDHGVYILMNVNAVTEGRQIRDLVLAALLRRALLNAEAIRRCLFHSLEEPAVALLRTLLETELNMRLVTAEDTQRMAKKLAAYHHLKAKRHVTTVLEHPEVRDGVNEFVDFMKGAGRNQKDYFMSPAFDEVRDELASSQHWHGYSNIREAFEAVGGDTDYLHLYDSFSPFVHVANLDFDFSDVIEGQPHMRALPQRDPERIQKYLQGCVFMLLHILHMYLEDKGAEDYGHEFTVTYDTGETHTLSPVYALQQHAIAIWGSSDGWEIGDTDPKGDGA